MTREEALYCMKANSVLHSEICEECPLYGDTGVDHCFEDALDEVIKALGQEPCEDCVSRQAVLDIDFRRIILTTAKPAEMIKQKVKALPSVNPQPQIGHWILRDDINGEYQCDECGMFSGLSKFDVEEARRKLSNFCPNCGAKMVKQQEREGKENE